MTDGHGVHSQAEDTRRKLVRFVLLFLFYALSLFCLFYFWQESIQALERWTATVSASLLGFFGFPTFVQGTNYSSGILTIEIIPECTGIFEIIIYTSIVLAYPAPWRKRLAGTGMGILAIIFLNMIRLLVLGLIGIRFTEIMEWVHLYLWQLTIILFVLALFLLWLAWISSNGKKRRRRKIEQLG